MLESTLPNQGFKPFVIGDKKINVPLALAPMSGVTNYSFRELIVRTNPGAVGLVVSEFISVEALTRHNPRCVQMMRYGEKQRPFSVQVFGYDIQRMADAAKMAEQAGADIVDINSGCPAPKVVKKGGGCELMRQPEHLAKALCTVRKGISIPLTLKIRAGWDNDLRNGLEIAKIAEAEGISMLAVHGRTKAEGYRGLADWKIIEEIASTLKIPVIGSGDVTCFHSAKERFASGVAGLMIGRAALSNPWVFSEVAAGFEGRSYQAPDYLATVDILETYLELVLEEMPEKGAIGKMKQFASQVTRRVPGSKMVRHALTRSQSLDEFSEKLEEWREYLSQKQQEGAFPPPGSSREANPLARQSAC